MSSILYNHAILGGTFDHLHTGHKALIDKACEMGKSVVIGITSDLFILKWKLKISNLKFEIEPFETRKKAVETYLTQNNWERRVTIIEISDRFGTTLSDSNLDVIIVSPETKPVAQEINLLRLAKEFSTLKIIQVPWVLAQDQKPIHSVRIRNGEIDRNGKLFSLNPDWKVRKLTENLRNQLKKPLGVLIEETSGDFEIAIIKFKEIYVNKNSFIISVGDAVTDALVKSGILPDVSVVDLQIQRKKVYQSVTDFGFDPHILVKQAKNEAGTLSYESFEVLKDLIRNMPHPNVLHIDGEEDLLTLFAILLAPLESYVVYGQPARIASQSVAGGPASPDGGQGGPASPDGGQGGPAQGIVVVPVTEVKKQEILLLLQTFTKSG